MTHEQITMQQWLDTQPAQKPTEGQQSFPPFMDALKSGEKGNCPCCGRYAQIYKRSIGSTVAWQLIHLLKLGGSDWFIHASKLVPDGQAGAGDLSKAKYFGLIIEQPHVEGKLKSSGFWKLTQTGVLYVHGVVNISAHCLVFDNKVIEFSDQFVSIQDALGKNFNYQELMSG